jgi:hypothetical protein
VWISPGLWLCDHLEAKLKSKLVQLLLSPSLGCLQPLEAKASYPCCSQLVILILVANYLGKDHTDVKIGYPQVISYHIPFHFHGIQTN